VRDLNQKLQAFASELSPAQRTFLGTALAKEAESAEVKGYGWGFTIWVEPSVVASFDDVALNPQPLPPGPPDPGSLGAEFLAES
jgi:hypothetical protein